MGHEVTVFHRGKTTADLPKGVSCIQSDRQNLTDFKSKFERISPQVVLDMIPSPDEISKWAVPELLDYTSEDAILASLKRNKLLRS